LQPGDGDQRWGAGARRRDRPLSQPLCYNAVDKIDVWTPPLFHGHLLGAAKSQPRQRDTIVNVYSTTKTMTALCALIFADRGELDFDGPVARSSPSTARLKSRSAS
jgi:CubicO group peptidase (beta-lactamase class C family)